MKCPSCATELKLSDRQGVELDYCPQCRGVWLDRGELDKIIERSSAPPARAYERFDDDDDDNDREHSRGAAGHGHPRKRKSWLGEMFDFGD